MGLGSIVGTGVFVSLGVAAGVAGSGILLVLPLAGLLALFNGLSSAQLAATYPVSGGTYEYGYRLLGPSFGFAAGLAFLLAKCASAATAALGFSGYLLVLIGVSPRPLLLVTGGVIVALGVTSLVLGGIRKSNRVNAWLIGYTLAALTLFLVFGLPAAGSALADLRADLATGSGGAAGPLTRSSFLQATALLFVAYTGYGRIATLGEEVRAPRHTIPRAIWATLAFVAVLYMGVAAVALGSLGPKGFSEATLQTAAPLQEAARVIGTPGLAHLVALAAVTAMLGVLLNLILGLSRVVLAMGRRGDLPASLESVDVGSGSPRAAVAVVGVTIGVLVLLGDVRTTWSFSAFTVLLYYGITNLAALRLPPEARLYPRWIPLLGLVGCLLLAFHVTPAVWIAGSVIVLGALGARAVIHRG